MVYHCRVIQVAGIKLTGKHCFKKERVNSLMSKVKDPGFRHKLVITFNIDANSFELITPMKNNLISSVQHNKEPTKYSTWLKLSEVSK